MMRHIDIRHLLRERSGPPFIRVHAALKRLEEAGWDMGRLSFEDRDALLEAHRAGHFDPPALEDA